MKFSLPWVLYSIPLALAQTVVYVDADTYVWDNNWNKDIQIHSSCNRTQYNQIFKGWSETKILAEQARDHTSRYGLNSDIYTKYFGNESTAVVVGIFDNILNLDKSNVLFRCDDIDGNCHQEGWAGHWRGENATDETVICDLSYTSRRFLSQMCSQGYEVNKGSTTLFWSSDFLHRIWHTETVGELKVDHYADTYSECLELAIDEPENSVWNSASLRYYALEVYAYDVALPGIGCGGDDDDDDDHHHSHESTSEASKSQSAGSTATSTQGTECHTHSNGDVHCS